MSYGRMMGWMVMGLFVSGCATGPNNQAMSRLQSQVGMLEERVSQLEHSSATAMAPAPAETAANPEASSMPAAAPEASKPASHHAATKYSKPSTREVQQALKNDGLYQGAIDGKMGPATEDAVKQFQHAQGLKEDGILGRHTWAKLRPYLDQPANSGEVKSGEAPVASEPLNQK